MDWAHPLFGGCVCRGPGLLRDRQGFCDGVEVAEEVLESDLENFLKILRLICLAFCVYGGMGRDLSAEPKERVDRAIMVQKTDRSHLNSNGDFSFTGFWGWSNECSPVE